MISAILISIAVLTVYNILIHPWMLDDSFISFRYAENFANGDGFVYNSGEKVEGYTSFLWVALLAVFKILGFDIIITSKFLGIVFSSACILLLFYAHRFIGGIDKRISAYAVMFLGTCGIFSPWLLSGMEVAMFTFWVLLSILIYLSIKQIPKNNLQMLFLGLICTFMVMTRPEGFLIFGIIFSFQLVGSIRKKDLSVLFLLAPLIVIYIPYFIWRYSYYGYLLPNTFYAKVGSTVDQVIRGFDYTKEFSFAALPFVLILLLILFLPRIFKQLRSLVILPITILIYTIYVILVGGDCMPAFRFFTPVMPLLCLLSAMAIPYFIKNKKQIVIILTIIIAYNILQIRLNKNIYDNIVNDKVALYGRKFGLWLKENVPANSVIATNTAGSIPYYSRLKTIDLLGMNDVQIAHRHIPTIGKGWAGHEKGDGAYVLSRRPYFIIFGSNLGSKYPIFLSDMEIYRNPKFHELYIPQVHKLGSNEHLYFYKKNDL